jgi:hypothetical protein
MDGRSDFYGEKIGRDYVTILGAQSGWREALERYHVEMVLVPPQTPLVELLVLGGGWHVLHRDQESVLLARNL